MGDKIRSLEIAGDASGVISRIISGVISRIIKKS